MSLARYIAQVTAHPPDMVKMAGIASSTRDHLLQLLNGSLAVAADATVELGADVLAATELIG